MTEKVLGVQCQKCKAVIPITCKGAYCPECGALMVWGFIHSIERVREVENEH